MRLNINDGLPTILSTEVVPSGGISKKDAVNPALPKPSEHEEKSTPVPEELAKGREENPVKPTGRLTDTLFFDELWDDY